MVHPIAMNTTEEPIESFVSNEEDPDEPSKQTKTGSILSYGRDFFLPTGLRCSVQNDLRLHRFLLDYNLRFLCPVGFLLWTLYLLLVVV